MKKVAIVQFHFEGGGGSCVLANIVKYYNNRGIKPDIITSSGISPIEFKTKLGINVSYNIIKHQVYGARNLLKVFLFNKSISDTIKKYDTVINCQGVNLFIDNHTDVYYVHYPKCKEVIENKNDNIFKRIIYQFISFILKMQSYNRKSTILVNSKYTKGKLFESYPSLSEKQVSILYPPVNISAFESCDPLTKNYKQIVSLGRISPDKRQHIQLIIADKLPSYDFVIIGRVSNKGYYERLKKTIRRRNLKNVRILNNLDSNDVIKAVRESSFFLHTKIGEHFGISIVEAIAARCIPIIHNSGGQKEILSYKKTMYSRHEEIPKIIDNITKNKIEKITEINYSYIRKFTKNNFFITLDTLINNNE